MVAPLALTQLALPLLRASDGIVIDVTSDAAVEAYPGWGGYGASKAATEQLRNVLAAEEPGVTVWRVDPGDLRTAHAPARVPGRGHQRSAAAVGGRAGPDAAAVRAPPSGRYRLADFGDRSNTDRDGPARGAATVGLWLTRRGRRPRRSRAFYRDVLGLPRSTAGPIDGEVGRGVRGRAGRPDRDRAPGAPGAPEPGSAAIEYADARRALTAAHDRAAERPADHGPRAMRPLRLHRADPYGTEIYLWSETDGIGAMTAVALDFVLPPAAGGARTGRGPGHRPRPGPDAGRPARFGRADAPPIRRRCRRSWTPATYCVVNTSGDDAGRARRGRAASWSCTCPPNFPTASGSSSCGSGPERRPSRLRRLAGDRSRSSAVRRCTLVRPYTRVASGSRDRRARRAGLPDGLRPADPLLLCGPGLADVDAYRSVFATTPGSAEMPSASRPFTESLVTRLVSRGIVFAPIMLHTGVASPEAHERPYPERFSVPADDRARWSTRRGRPARRIIASARPRCARSRSAADDARSVRAAGGWTSLVVTRDRRGTGDRRPVTGFHEPRASHLDMLHGDRRRRAAGRRCYAEALRGRYLWHEFGDINLLLRR